MTKLSLVELRGLRRTRLRAAAPDMLTALKEIARIGAIPDQNTEDRRLKRDEMWNIARAAIAKAEGRSSLV